MTAFRLILITFLALGTYSVQAQTPAPAAPKAMELRSYTMNSVPWGVAVDGEAIYFTMPGKDFNLTEQVEDGYIAVIKPGADKPELVTEAEYLVSPRGIYVDGDALVITDVNHVYKIDKNTGKMLFYSSLATDGPLSGLTGIAKMDDRLIVTCMDQNRLYFVDETSATFAELVTKEPIHSPAGVVWDPKEKVLYVAEAAYEVDRKGKEIPTGRLLKVDPVMGYVSVLDLKMRELRGRFVGLALKDGELYFSDWANDKKPEAIRKYNLEKQSVSNVATSAMQAVGQFQIIGNQIVIPAAKDKAIIIANLPPAPRR